MAGKVFDLAGGKGFERDVAVTKLVFDYTLYPRTRVNEYVVNQYRESHRAGAQFPPIVVDQKLRVNDGFHRATALMREGVAVIRAIYRKFKNDQEIFQAAVEANNAHGNQLSSWDRSRVIATAQDLGIEKEVIESMLAVTIDKIETVEKGFGFTSGANSEPGERPAPLKHSVRHLAGRKLTERQQNAHSHVGGMNQTFYINQVCLFLEGNLLDYKNEAVMSRLYHLNNLLEKVNFKKMAS